MIKKVGWVQMDPVKDCKVLFFTEKGGYVVLVPRVETFGKSFWRKNEKVQEGGSQCVLTPDDINIQDQRSSMQAANRKNVQNI